MVETYLCIVARVSVGLLLVIGGLGKMASVTRFRDVVSAYDILPSSTVMFVSLCLPVLEFAVGVCLIFRVWTPIGDLAAVGLFLVFSSAIAVNLARGRTQLSCGCFGGGSYKLAWYLVTRNLMLASLAICGTHGLFVVFVIIAAICAASTIALWAMASRRAGRIPSEVRTAEG
jgi:uncharacterized membrane protein YphA (DoxX/SURF4 family)